MKLGDAFGNLMISNVPPCGRNCHYLDLSQISRRSCYAQADIFVTGNRLIFHLVVFLALANMDL